MHISILLMEQIAELFLMIFMGFLIVKTGLLKDDDSKVLSKIVLYLIIPCVIINAFQVDYTMDTVKGLFIALAASVMIQIILLIIISVLEKFLHLNEVEIASVYYSNSGNLIVPITSERPSIFTAGAWRKNRSCRPAGKESRTSQRPFI